MDAIFSSTGLAFLAGRPDDAAATGAAAGLLALGCFFWVLVILGLIALQIWLFWRIFTKAGYSGAMSLLILVPGIGAFIVICILAFGNWPVLKDR